MQEVTPKGSHYFKNSLLQEVSQSTFLPPPGVGGGKGHIGGAG